MKTKHFKRDKRFSKKIAIDQPIEEKKDEIISFSLTAKETKLYKDWIDSLWNDMQIDDTEDSYVLYPKFQFSPFELGVSIKVIVGENELLLRTAWEDDEMKNTKDK